MDMESPNLFSEPLHSPFLNDYIIQDVPFQGGSPLPTLPDQIIDANDDMYWLEMYSVSHPNDQTVGSSGTVPNVGINGETKLANQIMTNDINFSCFVDPLVNQKWHGHQNHFPVIGSSSHGNHGLGINGYQNLAVDQGGFTNSDYMGMMNNGDEDFSPPTTPIVNWEGITFPNPDLPVLDGNTLIHSWNNNNGRITIAEGDENMGYPTTVNNTNIHVEVEHFLNNSTQIPQQTEGRQETGSSLQTEKNLEDCNVMNPLLLNFPNETPLAAAPANDCGECQILKVITHQNGLNVMKLELHGSLTTASFFHATITNYYTNQTQPMLQKLDFLNRNYDEIEQFLSHYLMERQQQGFAITDNHHSGFYNILCMGSKSYSVNTGNEIDEAEPSNRNIPPKKSRKEQIKIVESLTMEKVRSVLHHRREDGAKLLGICVSTLSNFLKRCGKSNRSWPSRKIQSLLCRIEKGRKRGEDVTNLQAKLDQIYAAYY